MARTWLRLERVSRILVDAGSPGRGARQAARPGGGRPGGTGAACGPAGPQPAPPALPRGRWRGRADSRRRGSSRIAQAVPAVTGLALGLLALGPALGNGFVLSYDMVFVPHPPLSAAAGWSGGPPRAVPSDAVVDLLSVVFPAQAVQKAALLSIFVLACSGVALLLRGLPLPARVAAGIFYTWNPYVAERLVLGQWALLLGYAGLPWVLRALARPARAGLRIARLCLALVPAAIGGFAAMSVSALVAVPAAVSISPGGRTGTPAGGPDADAGRQAGGKRGAAAASCTVLAVLAVLAVASLPWLIPALSRPVRTAGIGVDAFAARADTPFGSLGSLLMLGGAWNAETVPRGYGGAASVFWLALTAAGIAGYALRCRRDPRWPGLGLAAVAGLLIAGIGITAPGRDLLRALVALWPGFAVLRDGQQFVAPLALAEAVGIGSLLDAGLRATARGRDRRADQMAGVLASAAAVLAPLLLLPGLALGAGGRLRPATYPADWLRARAVIDSSRATGNVVVLPWAAYRRFAWNHGEAVLDPWPRLLGRTVIWNDAVRVGNTSVPAEDPAARRLDGLLTSARPLTAALRCAGVAFVIVDAGPAAPGGPAAGRADRPSARFAGAAVALQGPDVVVYQLDDRGKLHVRGDCAGLAVPRR